jgi:hypothetical protein
MRAVPAERIAVDGAESVLVQRLPAAVAAEAVNVDAGREAERASGVLKWEDREPANHAYVKFPANFGACKA